MGRGGLYSVRPPDEDAIWQSEMRLKGASGGRGGAHTPDLCIRSSSSTLILKAVTQFLTPLKSFDIHTVPVVFFRFY